MLTDALENTFLRHLSKTRTLYTVRRNNSKGVGGVTFPVFPVRESIIICDSPSTKAFPLENLRKSLSIPLDPSQTTVAQMPSSAPSPHFAIMGSFFMDKITRSWNSWHNCL